MFPGFDAFLVDLYSALGVKRILDHDEACKRAPELVAKAERLAREEGGIWFIAEKRDGTLSIFSAPHFDLDEDKNLYE